jgi:hypothetical protein
MLLPRRLPCSAYTRSLLCPYQPISFVLLQRNCHALPQGLSSCTPNKRCLGAGRTHICAATMHAKMGLLWLWLACPMLMVAQFISCHTTTGQNKLNCMRHCGEIPSHPSERQTQRGRPCLHHAADACPSAHIHNDCPTHPHLFVVANRKRQAIARRNSFLLPKIKKRRCVFRCNTLHTRVSRDTPHDCTKSPYRTPTHPLPRAFSHVLTNRRSTHWLSTNQV